MLILMAKYVYQISFKSENDLGIYDKFTSGKSWYMMKISIAIDIWISTSFYNGGSNNPEIYIFRPLNWGS